MSGFCDFCHVWHSSSCYHPGQVQLTALRQRVEALEQINFDHELGFHAANTEIIDLTVKLAAVTHERVGWESDARAAQANWHAACEDIGKLQATLQAVEWALKRLVYEVSKLECTSPYQFTGNDVQLAEELDKAKAALQAKGEGHE